MSLNSQLRTDDIYQDSYLDDDNEKIEVWTLIVTNEGEDQELKNDGSRRVIPLHSELIRLGFIKYVNGLKKGLVFPDLTKAGAYDSLSTNWSKWFGRYLRTVVLIKDERMVFHSFRHCFKDYARAASIPSEIHNALTGHSSGNVADNYGSVKYPLRPLAEAMNKFKVTGLTLPFAAFS
ncbi:site-specific integrase [Methylotenera sp.]|uniref:site-specific integrase n=1 Tax=Methylotenera sp. TaxID=2051956 RepID=UPI002733C5E8|nr:site-specific integrase [Methylotenera sp.]MDP3006625.1 site-specific integrase [Methylotenera sp.]